MYFISVLIAYSLILLPHYTGFFFSFYYIYSTVLVTSYFADSDKIQINYYVTKREISLAGA